MNTNMTTYDNKHYTTWQQTLYYCQELVFVARYGVKKTNELTTIYAAGKGVLRSQAHGILESIVRGVTDVLIGVSREMCFSETIGNNKHGNVEGDVKTRRRCHQVWCQQPTSAIARSWSAASLQPNSEKSSPMFSSCCVLKNPAFYLISGPL